MNSFIDVGKSIEHIQLTKWHGICLKFFRMSVSSVPNIIYQFNNTIVNGMASKLFVTFADYFLSGIFS